MKPARGIVHGEVKVLRPGKDGELVLQKTIAKKKLTVLDEVDGYSGWSIQDQVRIGDYRKKYTPVKDGLQ